MGRTDPVIHHGDLKEHDALNNVKVHQTLISDFLSSEPPSMHIVLKILMVGHFTYNFGKWRNQGQWYMHYDYDVIVKSLLMCTMQSTVCLITDLRASSIHPAPHEESQTDNLPFHYHLQQKSAYSRKKNNGLLSYTSAAFQSLVRKLGCQPWILMNRPNHKKYIH